MSFLACEETNGVDFALTMSPDKSTASQSVPARQGEIKVWAKPTSALAQTRR